MTALARPLDEKRVRLTVDGGELEYAVSRRRARRCCCCTPSRSASSCGTRRPRRSPRRTACPLRRARLRRQRPRPTARSRWSGSPTTRPRCSTTSAIAKAVVGGCSMGGYAALAFVRRHPQRLAGLVLQDTRAGADSDGGAGRPGDARGEGARRGRLGRGRRPSCRSSLGETTQREQPALVARPAGAHPRHVAAGDRRRAPRPRGARRLAPDARRRCACPRWCSWARRTC